MVFMKKKSSAEKVLDTLEKVSNVLEFKTIEDVLKSGYKLHAFSSGGRLRVVYFEKEGEQKFYGESCNIYEALRILKDDIKFGGRQYKEVYGPIEPHYLTGEHPVDNFDCLVYQSDKSFTAYYEDGNYVVRLQQSVDPRLPKEVEMLVLSGKYNYQEINDDERGIFWKLKINGEIRKSSSYWFANHSKGTSTQVVLNPAEDFFIKIPYLGTSNESFDKALEDAKSKLPNDLNEIDLEYEILSEQEFKKLKTTI